MEHCLHTPSARANMWDEPLFFSFFFLRLYPEAICGCSWTRVPRNRTLRRRLSKEKKNRRRRREMIISRSSACPPASCAPVSRSSSTRSNHTLVHVLAFHWRLSAVRCNPADEGLAGGTSQRLAGRQPYRPLQSIHLWALGVGVRAR